MNYNRYVYGIKGVVSKWATGVLHGHDAHTKLTDWFHGSIKPVHAGVYEVVGYGSRVYQCWNGRFWGLTRSDVCSAYRDRDERSMFQDESWRGLTDDAS